MNSSLLSAFDSFTKHVQRSKENVTIVEPFNSPNLFGWVNHIKQAVAGRRDTVAAVSGSPVVFRSILNFPIGYAFCARHIARALENAGASVSYQYAYGPGTVFTVRESRYFADPVLRAMSRRKPPVTAPLVCFSQADVFRFSRGPFRAGYSMLEVDGIPEEWVRQCNEMDEIWVPSSFNKATFMSSGVKVPVQVIPLGVDAGIYSPDGDRFLPPVFTFLSVFEWGDRKAPELLIRAFNMEFKSTEPVALFCKVMNHGGRRELQEKIRNLEIDYHGGKIFFLVNCQLDDRSLAFLYRSCDTFVLPSRGEGWGMPYLESLACGVPVIATRWSSHLDFLDDSNAYLIDIKGLVPATESHPYYRGFRWAEPSEEHLRHIMRAQFKKGRHSGQRQADFPFTWDKTAHMIMKRLERNIK